MELMSFVVIGGITALYHIPGLIREKKIKELVIFCVLLALSLVLAGLDSAGITLPSPAKGIETVIKLFAEAKFGYQP